MSNNYFNPNHVLSYNKAINFIVALRGYGKTYSTKKHSVNRFIKKGEQFIYIKRFKTDFVDIETFFDGVSSEFPDHELSVKGKTFICDGNVCGYAIPLSTWQSRKSAEFTHVTTIIFDEFIKEKDMSHYLPNEVNAFLNLLDTIVRNRDNWNVFMLGNAVTLANPYFLYFNLFPKKDQEIYRSGEILVNIPKAEKFINERKNTKMGRVMQDTEYENFALYNEWKEDGEAFIEKRTPQSKYYGTILVNGIDMGIWYDKYKKVLYLSKKANNKHSLYIVTKRDDFSEGKILVTNHKNHYITNKLVLAYKNNQLRFDDIYCRSLGYEMLKQIKTY